ncbi:MAG TPA: FKBP-type peptidyl-prolyl cis-trans isomerase [Chiayiivirga sp.]|jgi:FKBP-type peptidyl-prolyl cis-trans isomerase|uniref:Peptidyl-prolyl cis-trans isomerase n=1 Tax=Denitratimonas tolerans TaxID=1338420 RepID=A0AAW9R983_9GAMM|nr:FKBP-type peptidyl-prolyl cis-trans isomerase [Xanthomonadaceae bacterium]MDX9763583.1 FKBP-type peptidyl-prolyl cis-trans isomerase [Chiayiivirga sp.]MEB2314636.1 FKBP-type peptidyl-prolyl cis-trans isomerase [Xanthomonadaceae bacterium]HMN34207.1 FKBP-type peptidyl-prolyl cis-trans isomerase [Chiayiivirga sp.]HRN59670.1 FKBP-type peptidyl-prolyl cis-trans isomerase [Chiayiivirga sp.]
MKLRWTVALLAATTMSAALAQDTTSEKGKLSYAVGYQIGQDFTERKVDVDLSTVIRAIQDGYAKRDPAVPAEQMGAALEAMQKKLLDEAKAEFDKVAGENKRKSDAFLAQNRSKTGVQTLSSGIQYRVIETGTGAKPTAASDVKIHFRGSLSTGQEFASTYQGNEPVSMRVGEAPLPGLRQVLPMMTQGSRWEVFMPAEQAYGDSVRPIGPNQAVVFDVKLVEVK